MDDYFEIVRTLGNKLKRKRKALGQEARNAEENANLFRIRWKVYKKISPIVKKLLLPLIEALRQKYEVEFKIYPSGSKRSSFLEISWKIRLVDDYYPHSYFKITLPDKQDCLILERYQPIVISRGEDKLQRVVKPITEGNLKEAIKKVFLDYINQFLA